MVANDMVTSIELIVVARITRTLLMVLDFFLVGSAGVPDEGLVASWETARLIGRGQKVT